jgi:hypothetical protein
MRWTWGGVLVALLVVIIVWARFASDSRDGKARSDSAGPSADGAGEVQSAGGTGVLQSTPTPRGTDGVAVGSLAELEVAEARGAFLGTMTPEQAWHLSAPFRNPWKVAGLKTTILPCSWGAFSSGLSASVSSFFRFSSRLSRRV